MATAKKSKEDALQAKIEAKMAALKAEALEEVETDEEAAKANEDDWSKRYRCKISEVSRKGSKNLEMYVNHPKNHKRPYKLNIKLGAWIEEGLPMSVISRIQSAFDTDAEDKEEHEMTGSAGDNHRMFRSPRFAVQLGKLVEQK